MSKTTARTFIAATLLLAASLAINIYGQRIVESPMMTEEGLPLYTSCSHCSSERENWERAAALLGLLAISVSIAGAMFWDREAGPMTEQASLLRLDDSAARRTNRVAAPSKSVGIADARIIESTAHLREDESLTPLERVIRGY